MFKTTRRPPVRSVLDRPMPMNVESGETERLLRQIRSNTTAIGVMLFLLLIVQLGSCGR